MTEHDFTKRPENCPGCHARRATRPHQRPAKVPGIADPDLLMQRANRAAQDAVKKLRADEAARCAVADSWNLVIQEIDRNLSPPVSTVSN
jgi:hypothetical protein